MKIEGAVVLVSQDGMVVTAYRNRKAHHHIQKKAKVRFNYERRD